MPVLSSATGTGVRRFTGRISRGDGKPAGTCRKYVTASKRVAVQLLCPAGGATLRLKMYARSPMIGSPPVLFMLSGSALAKVIVFAVTLVTSATMVAIFPPTTMTRSPACSPTPGALIGVRAGTGAGAGTVIEMVEPDVTTQTYWFSGNA